MHEPQAENTEDAHAAVKKVSAPREQNGFEGRQRGWEDRNLEAAFSQSLRSCRQLEDRLTVLMS